ncbi:uncharacterized protein LOC116033295 [Ipomoea triloba]|uniref:uncharacterized protein LOC116033295 n=1 Tax=Ipomoea triloba TaxID=35885 RepID=UPI00125D54C3|nr:uncharacterized protein LOC116033295 [Ipomoea triloba]
MKHLLRDLISESQSAFIPGRLITDNILVAAEVGHYLNRKQCGLVGWGALKLDMAKAYDRMGSFLRKMLLALGFVDRWVDLIMLCVTTVSYNILINGVSGGQVVNYHKSSVCFSRNTTEDSREEVVEVLVYHMLLTLENIWAYQPL